MEVEPARWRNKLEDQRDYENAHRRDERWPCDDYGFGYMTKDSVSNLSEPPKNSKKHEAVRFSRLVAQRRVRRGRGWIIEARYSYKHDYFHAVTCAL